MSNELTYASGGGVTLGSVLAVVLSWTVNHSILYCILHFFCSWVYVVYWVFLHSGSIK